MKSHNHLIKQTKKREKEGRSTEPTFKSVMMAFLASTAAAFLLVLAGLSLAGTAVAFVTCVPLFLVFSPVLVPAGITTTVLASGLMAGGGFGATALTILLWLYKKFTGKEPPKIPWLTPGGDAGGAAGGSAPGGPAPDGSAPAGGAAPDGSAPGGPAPGGAAPGGPAPGGAAPTTKPVAKPTAKPKAKPAAKPKPKPAAKPVAKPAKKPKK